MFEFFGLIITLSSMDTTPKTFLIISSFQQAIICEIWMSRTQVIGPWEVKVPNKSLKGTPKQADHSCDFWKNYGQA